MRLLDIACGTGVGTAEAARRGARMLGVDFSPEMLAEARRLHGGLAFQQADAQQLPLESGSFDAAISNFGVHHMERPERAIAEARRVVRAGGRFAFTLWVKPQDNPAWRLLLEAVVAHGRLDAPMPAGNDGHNSIAGFSQLAVRAGFQPENVSARTIEKTWRLPPGADLVSAFATATVRTASLLHAQSADALRAIRQEVAGKLDAFRREDGAIELPTRAFMICAQKESAP
jgi:SAM-dependent methyltransferase